MNILTPQRRFKRRDFLLSLMPIIAASRRRSSYLVSEDFEGTGTPSGWTTSGSPDFDYATSPAPLVGSQSLYCADSTAKAIKGFSSQSEVWVFCRMWRTAVPTSTNQATILLYSGAAATCYLASRTTSNQWRFYVGTTLAGTFTVSGSDNADVSVWIRYKAGTGANAEGALYMAVGTETRPGSPSVTTSIGNATASASQIYLYGNTGSPHIFDKVRVSASPIGSNPA